MYSGKKKCGCTKKKCKHMMMKSSKSSYGKGKQAYSSEEDYSSSSSSSSSSGDFSRSSYETSNERSYDSSDFSSSSSSEEKQSFKSSKQSSFGSKYGSSSEKLSKKELASEKASGIKFDKVKYEAHVLQKPSEFFSEKNGALKDKGRVILDVSKGDWTRISGTNEPDFKKVRVDQKGGRHDLIKSAKLIMFCNYPQTMTVGLTSIPNREGTFSRDNKKYVNWTIEAGTFKPEGSRYEATIFERDVDPSIQSYANKYSGYNPDNLEVGINYTKKHMILPIDNPVLMTFNHKYKELAQYAPNAKQFKNTNEVMIPKDKGIECLKIAKEKLSNSISLGNCNDKFKMVISAVPPNHRKLAHDNAKVQWKGFADIQHRIASNPTLIGLDKHPDTGLPLEKHFEETPLMLDVWIEFEYVRLDGKKL